MSAPAIVWLRQDLRLQDNPALAEAAASGRPVIPVYILDDAAAGAWAMGGASRWWLHHSLSALSAALADLGAPLVLRRGDAGETLDRLIAETGAGAVYWNRRYEPLAVAQDTAIKAQLAGRGLDARSFNAALLFEPWTVRTQAGEPFKVFTPFWRAAQASGPIAAPLPAPRALAAPAAPVAGEALEDWGLLPGRPDWARSFGEMWQPGEAGALRKLTAFLDGAIIAYASDRDRPDTDGTSMLSPHLHFGEIGPRQVWQAVRFAAGRTGALEAPAAKFLAEIGWREFSYHLLHQAPHLPETAFRPEFAHFPWADDRTALARWQAGQTGVPIVDAGMRQLWTYGWMHNRVRMVAASFLVKHLLIPWQDGEAWFWDTLVDADLASNAASWQWVAGCGADAAPYFRVFNPVLQGEKFDPNGDYVRAHVPELAGLPAGWIHKPWEAPEVVLAGAGVALGRTYPHPIINLQAGRARALAAFSALRA